jgi:hypothetical protein
LFHAHELRIRLRDRRFGGRSSAVARTRSRSGRDRRSVRSIQIPPVLSRSYRSPSERSSCFRSSSQPLSTTSSRTKYLHGECRIHGESVAVSNTDAPEQGHLSGAEAARDLNHSSVMATRQPSRTPAAARQRRQVWDREERWESFWQDDLLLNRIENLRRQWESRQTLIESGLASRRQNSPRKAKQKTE